MLAASLALFCCSFDSPGPGWHERYLLQPATVTSASGRYALRVVPSDRSGDGPATYALFRGGEPLWSRELPFAFRRFVVRDDGVAAGFAYLRASLEDRELRVAALAPSGEVLWVHQREEEPPESAEPRDPIFRGLHLVGDGETLVLRSEFMAGGPEEWWAFDLATGAVDRSMTQRLLRPPHKRFLRTVAGRGVPGTPLAIVSWIEWGATPQISARYALHGSDGRAVWELHLPDDLGTRAPSEDQAEAALLAVGERSFELAFLKEDLRVAFEVEEARPAGWKVRETGRRKLGGLSIPAPPAPTTPWRAVELELLGEVAFKAEGDPRAPDELPEPLLAFDIDGSGRIGGLYDQHPGSSFALLDEAGRVLRSFELESVEEVEHVRWVGGSTWFLYSPADWPKGRGHWLDVERQELVEIEGWNGLAISDAELHPDGDLVVLGLDAIHRFRPPGTPSERAQRPWTEPQVERPAEHLAILADGTLAVAINEYPPRLERFRSDGTRAQVALLEQHLGEYGAVDELLAPHDGTLWFRSRVLERVQGPSVWHRLSVDLSPLGPVAVSLENGIEVASLLERLGPDGSGWGRDAWGLIRFDLTRGRAEPLGSLPIRPLDDYVQDVTVDTQGRVYLCGEGDAIFVFDAEGTLLHVCRPERGDSALGLDMEWISVRGDGHVFGGDEWDDQRLEFDTHGRRVRVHFVEPREDFWTFWPGGLKRWVMRWPGTIELRGAEGELEARVDRLHDGRWFTGARPLSVARDGSFAFARLDGLHVFDASGAPRGSRSLAYEAEEPGYWHPAGILHEGQRTILSSEGRLVAFHADDPVAEVVELPERVQGRLFRSPDGAELWLFPDSEPRMLRFASPPSWR